MPTRMRSATVLLVLFLLLPRGSASRAPTASPAQSWTYEERFDTNAAKGGVQNAVWDTGQQHVRLLRHDAAEQRDPSGAADPQGNLVIVWVDNRDKITHLYLQKLDPQGNRMLPNDYLLPTDHPELNHYRPKIKIDAVGNIYVAWLSEVTHNDYDLFVQKFSSSFQRLWAADVRINPVDGTAGDLDIALGGQNDLYIGWLGSYDIKKAFLSRIKSDGAALWPVATTLSESASSGDIAVAYAGGSNVTYVFWRDYDGSAYKPLLQAVNASGEKVWQNNVDVSQTLAEYYSGLSLAISDLNEIYAKYDQGNSDGSSYIFKINHNGILLWNSPLVVNGSQGKILIIGDKLFVSNIGEYLMISIGMYTGDSGTRIWEDRFRVQGGMPYDPSFIASPAGFYVLVADYYNIMAHSIGTGGTFRWRYPVFANDDGSGDLQSNPSLAIDGQQRIRASWRNLDSWGMNAQVFDSSGQYLWPTPRKFPLSNSIYLSALGDVTFISTDNQGADFLEKIDPNANIVWTDRKMITASNRDSNMVHHIANANGVIFIVWEEVDGRMYAQKMSSSGALLWTSDKRVDTNKTSQNGEVSLALDAVGNLLVVWTNDASGNRRMVYAQKLDGQGNRVWASDVLVSDYSNSWGTYKNLPTAAADVNGNLLVAWSEHRDGQGGHIYIQKLSPQGARLWSGDIAVDQGSTATEPGLAIDSGNNTVVVWREERNSTASTRLLDVYAQKISTGGARLWSSDVRVSGESDPVVWSMPKNAMPDIAIDASNTAYVAWVGNRSGTSSVFMQKLSSAGVRLWPGDLDVTAPDQSYYPAGTVESRPIDAVPQDITTALLSADYQPNGGGVAFFLSNDGGTHWASAEPGATHVFTTAGSDLRWRADLTADPAWPRGPTINRVSIEYSDSPLLADAYEPDNTCPESSPITVNGAAQDHTFHNSGDADWVRFAVVSGAVYVIQTTGAQQNVDLKLELASGCAAAPAIAYDNPYGRDLQFVWRAPASGEIYLRFSNQQVAAGQGTGYTAFVRGNLQEPTVVIVAGHNDDYALQSNIDNSADRAYRTLLAAGVAKSDIRYLGPTTARDVDGNGANDDIAAVASPALVRAAIETWARDRGMELGRPFWLYLVGHGAADQFQVSGSHGQITAADLNLWLSNLEAMTGADNVTVVIEASLSGSFIDSANSSSISGRNRVVISASSSSQNAFPSSYGTRFSELFWSNVAENADLLTAWRKTNLVFQAAGLDQRSWIDDNGDGLSDARDGGIARRRGLANPAARQSPVVAMVKADPGDGRIEASVYSDQGVARVWAEIYRPDLSMPPGGAGTPPLSVPSIGLAPGAGAQHYAGLYQGFDIGGWYRILVYAEDTRGQLSMAGSTMICLGCRTAYLPLVRR